MKIVFATNNLHKLEELRHKLNDKFELLSLNEIGFFEEIPEDFPTLSENSFQKAEYIYSRFKLPCIADDTGLEIEALNGSPGVYSARYSEKAGFDLDNPNRAEANTKLILQQLEGINNRNACFKTIISLIDDNHRIQFEGSVSGKITKQPYGEKGFGYDPVFMPEGYEQTFAQMPLDVKNTISHRARAVEKLICFLQKDYQSIL